ncbi:hypothetical protein [Pseudoalteromonas rubra]|uniref:hypothetical protein n=1 Tax=Pseudoalteromonas rubra TaxID=43658 RepID=UPI001486DAA8|nr:hypothetical protein [Pseudoalteromonas rubra]
MSLEPLLKSYFVGMTNTPKQTYSALKGWFKQLPHPVRDDNGVVGKWVSLESWLE